MDLYLGTTEPTKEERAAVDAYLGPPATGWDGGTRVAARDGRVADGGPASAEVRHRLLPALQAVQARVGWISEGALRYVSERLGVPPAETYGVATFYALISLEERAGSKDASPQGRRLVCGSPETVREGIEAAAREYGASEVMIVTIVHEHPARRRSYELIADAFGLAHAPREPGAVSKPHEVQRL